MIQPLSAVKDAYLPHFAVDSRFVTSAFVGCLLESGTIEPGGRDFSRHLPL